MKLEEIFVDSPELRQHPEVIKLINYSLDSFKTVCDALKRHREKEDKINAICFECDAFYLDGPPAADAIRAIIRLE